MEKTVEFIEARRKFIDQLVRDAQFISDVKDAIRICKYFLSHLPEKNKRKVVRIEECLENQRILDFYDCMKILMVAREFLNKATEYQLKDLGMTVQMMKVVQRNMFFRFKDIQDDMDQFIDDELSFTPSLMEKLDD